jgi:hypothetical protein
MWVEKKRGGRVYYLKNPNARVAKMAPIFILLAACLSSSGTFPQKKNGPGIAISTNFGKCFAAVSPRC